MRFFSALLIIGLVCTVLILINPQSGLSHSIGAPDGVSGSPFDGGTCVRPYCHLGTLTQKDSMISIDIPATGYVPGHTYTISARISEPGGTIFGFEVAPRFCNGNVAGILEPIDSSTQTITANYITHTLAGTKGNNSRLWMFNWTAPQKNEGPVTFYGAFLTTDISGFGGYKVYNSNLKIAEEGFLGTTNFTDAGIKVYPIPFKEVIYINTDGIGFSAAKANLYTIEGRLVAETVIYNNTAQLQTGILEKGLYILVIEGEGTKVLQKIMK